MSKREFLRPYILHSCYSPQLMEERKANCKCKLRVSDARAKELIDQGLAEWVVVDYVLDPETKQLAPIRGWSLVYTQQVSDLKEAVRSSYAAKTPRVETVEKAHIVRAYCDENQDDIDRIEVWGQMSRSVIEDLMVPFVPDSDDGRAVLPLIGFDQRGDNIS